MRASIAPRGYFGIGVEGISKPMNLGALLRTAHAFGASFAFAIAPDLRMREAKRSDTSAAPEHLPFYSFAGAAELMLPQGCALVGVELLEDASELPSFRHPQQAAYVLGPERGSLSPDLVALCDFVVRIPTRFCVNLSVAGAIVLYDRLLSTGRFAERPVTPGGPPPPLAPHRHGAPIWVKKRARRTGAGD
jgi:tRNA G18 (ribose-2'-O)-methylase SpoU